MLLKALLEIKLDAPHRVIPDDSKDFGDYIKRVDSKSKLTNAKGRDKDRFKYPFIHNKTIKDNINLVDTKGNPIDYEKFKSALRIRPNNILMQNKKMAKSGDDDTIYANMALPALKGLALDEETNEFLIVDTCPGAGSCQVFCYAKAGNYIITSAPSERTARVLTFLLNDPDGFIKKVGREIEDLKYKGRGKKVAVRWHDAGDFFSPQYLELAFTIANNHPDVDFFAYTKMASVIKADTPDNFIIQFSSGANPREEKQVDLKKHKHSYVVPKKVFQEFLIKNGNKIQTDDNGVWLFTSIPQLKQRIADYYNIDIKTLLTYKELQNTPKSNQPNKWNVIVAKGEGDDSANRLDVLGTYLLEHK